MQEAQRIKGWQGDFPTYRGPWLGQQEPGNKPVEFAPEIFDTDKMSFGATFSSDGGELFFGYARPGHPKVHDIVSTRLVDGVWTVPERLPFNSNAMDGDHCLSLDGNRMIWRSWRLLPEETEPREWTYLWWSERIDGTWSKERLLTCGDEIQRTGYPALGRSGTLYFAARTPGRQPGIFRSRRDGDTYGPREEIISGMQAGGDMCVAPDERYLIITCAGEPENLGQSDLFISFRRDDDTWTPLRHLGDLVNTPGDAMETNCPTITPDGRYLFYRLYNFDTGRCRVFWINASFLDDFNGDP